MNLVSGGNTTLGSRLLFPQISVVTSWFSPDYEEKQKENEEGRITKWGYDPGKHLFRTMFPRMYALVTHF